MSDMWHAVSSVLPNYDPVIYEGHEEQTAVILNAGPGTIEARAWSHPETFRKEPLAHLEMRPGDERAISGALIRLSLKVGHGGAAPMSAQGLPFASAAWRLETDSPAGAAPNTPWHWCPLCWGLWWLCPSIWARR